MLAFVKLILSMGSTALGIGQFLSHVTRNFRDVHETF